MKAYSRPLHGLSGDLWPIHIKPRPDELLSSWLIRFAHVHQLKTECLCTLLFGRYSPIWNRDIDKLAPRFVLDGLAAASGTTNPRAWLTTLPSYAGMLSESVNSFGNSRWIVPLGVFHRSRLRPGLMFCPECLAEEGTRYYRRIWRVAWATVCCRHGCHLQDVCPRCNAPIAPHRTDMSDRAMIPHQLSMFRCYACSHLLSKSSIVSASSECIEFQKMLERALELGFIEWAGSSNIYSILFFDGLRALSAGMLRHQRRLLQRGGVSRPVLDLEHLPLCSRIENMRLLASLTQNWPDRLTEYVKRENVRYTELQVFGGSIPFWYWAAIREVMVKTSILTEGQIDAIFSLSGRELTWPSSDRKRMARLLRAKLFRAIGDA